MAGDDQTQETRSPGSGSSPSDKQTTSSQELYPGLTLGGRYLIERELGRGGVGIVYLARDQQLLSRRVVIKVLLEKVGHPESHGWFKKKFRQEMEALARIDHPGVVGVIDAGELPSGKSYLVMQYVEGVNLRAIMKVEGMDFAHVADLVRQIGQALNAAHDKGVYHRDLKPENIMVQNLSGREEYIKLIDFGIATITDSQVATSSSTTAVAGTVRYMAPEQLMGKPSAASDVYALGVMAYEMLTGRRPFNPASPVQLYELQRAGVKVRPIDLRPGLPEAAQDVILKALSFDAKDRHSRARDFGEELARAMSADEQVVQPDAPIQQSFPYGEAPNLGPFVFKTCDRSRQVNEFTNFFIDNLKQRSGCPQVYLVRGEERECHDSLVQRLIHTQIKRFAEKKWGQQRSVITVKKLGWTYEGELEELQQELERILFAGFDPAYMEDDLSATGLSKLSCLSLNPLVVIQHRIHAARWDKLMRALIEWYFAFWAELTHNTSSPQFVIFLNIIYPKAQAAGWRKIWLGPGRFDKNRIETELREISALRNAGLPCLILRELLPIRQDEVKDWFSFNNIYSEKTRYELLEKIFMTGNGRIAEHKSMADIEHELQGLVESIQQSFIRTRGCL